MPAETMLSAHFDMASDYDQITWSKTAGIRIEPNPLQAQLHRELAFTVEMLFRLPLNVPTRVTSGQRNSEISAALKKADYPVSEVSDHYFMDMIEVRPGYFWNGSTGAWDFEFPGNEDQTYNFFLRAYRHLHDDKELRSRVGQMIYYPDMKIIHLSNAYELAFGSGLVQVLQKLRPNREQFLYKIKGGFRAFTGQMI